MCKVVTKVNATCDNCGKQWQVLLEQQTAVYDLQKKPVPICKDCNCTTWEHEIFIDLITNSTH